MELVGGTAPPLKIDTHAVPLLLLPIFMVLGAGLGVLGVLFNRCLVAALDWRAAAFRRAPFVFAVLVGAAVGALAIVLPFAVGGGETLIPRMIVTDLPILTLLLIAVVRFVGTMASYPVGVPAGIFSPLLAFATVVGLIAGALIEMMLTAAALPMLPVPPLIGAAFAVAAMGGLFSATIRAPLVGVVLVVELTGGYELILPVHHHLRDRPCRRRIPARPADLRSPAGARPAAGRPPAARALGDGFFAGRDRRANNASRPP